MAKTYLPLEHHVVRYVPWARLRKDENDNVVGVLGAAFRLRNDEEFLSATWAEFFKGDDHAARIASAVKAIRASRVEVKPRSGFAVGNVRKIKEVCFADSKQYKIRVIHEPEDDNKAHTALRRWPRDNEDLLDLIAEEAWGNYVLNRDIRLDGVGHLRYTSF
jgi:hypothetical protein